MRFPAKLTAFRSWHTAMLLGAALVAIAFLPGRFALQGEQWLVLGFGLFVMGMATWANPKPERAYFIGKLALFFGTFLVVCSLIGVFYRLSFEGPAITPHPTSIPGPQSTLSH